MHPTPRRRFAFLVALLLTLAPGVRAQNIEQGDDGIFLDTVDVNVVNVDVYVTDRKGNVIQGLKRDDFELFVDGKPMTVSNFYAVEEGEARVAGERELPPPPPPDPLDRWETRPSVPADQQLHLVIYIDNLNLHPFTRNKAIRFIRTFLRQRLSPSDQVMLVTYERSLHVRHNFTSDPELIASALYEIETHSAMATHQDNDRREILELIYEEQGAQGLNYNSVRGRAITYAQSIENDMRFTLQALEDVVENLAGLPGRKAVLYISDGLQMRPGEDIFHAIDDRFRGQESSTGVLMEVHRFDLAHDFNQLTTKANANRVTFYTLDAQGLRTYTYFDASNRSAGGGARIDQVYFSNLHNSLSFMAAETGGLAILNTNDFGKMLDRVASDFSSYYSLGFSPASTTSGRYHNINVKVKGAGKKYIVRHREGFREKPMSTRMSEGTMAALHFGFQSNALGVNLRVGEMRPQEKDGRVLVPIDILIPLDNIGFLSAEGTHRARLRLYLAALDEKGGTAPVQEIAVPIDVPADQLEAAKGKYFKHQITLRMRTGRQVLALGYRDEISAVNGFVRHGLRVDG